MLDTNNFSERIQCSDDIVKAPLQTIYGERRRGELLVLTGDTLGLDTHYRPGPRALYATLGRSAKAMHPAHLRGLTLKEDLLCRVLPVSGWAGHECVLPVTGWAGQESLELTPIFVLVEAILFVIDRDLHV